MYARPCGFFPYGWRGLLLRYAVRICCVSALKASAVSWLAGVWLAGYWLRAAGWLATIGIDLKYRYVFVPDTAA